MDMVPDSEHLSQFSRFDQARHLGRKPVTLGSISQMLRRRWRLIAAVAALITGAAIATSLLLTPQYDAVARIRIIPASQSPLDYDTTKELPLDQALLNTEIATIRSRDIARRVVTDNDLQGDREFAGVRATTRGNAADIARAIETATTAVLAHLTVEQQEKSYVVTVGFRSINAVKAARIANAIAIAYINNTADLQMSTAARQAATGREALQRLGVEAEGAANNVAHYRADSGIVQSGPTGTVTEQQVGPLSMQLATAESQAAAARSNVEAAEQQIASGGTDAVSAVLSSGVIADLRRQRTEAERQRALYAAKYGPKFPTLVQSNQQIEAFDQQIRQEQVRIVSGLRGEARAAQAQATNLREQLSSLNGQIANNNKAAVRAESLQRQADAATSAYNRMAGSVQQASQAQRSNEPQARVLESAVVSARPGFPNRPAMAAAGMLGGLVLGFGAALIGEGLHSVIRSPDEIETMLGLKFIVSVQQLTRRQRVNDQGRRCMPADTLRFKQVSAYSEAFRTIRNAIRPAGAKVVSISSTLPSEGKTTMALSLSRVMAMSGDRVLLIDCDVRRAGLSLSMNHQMEYGIVEVLEGKATPAQAIVADAIPGLDFISVRAPTFTPIDLFSNGDMANLLTSLRETYDHIVLDTPPLLGVADARTLATLADGAIVLIKWNDTPLSAIDAAIAGLENDGSSILGAVLTMVDPRSDAMGALYYSSRYSSYYEQ